jgi:L-arabinose isomerase
MTAQTIKFGDIKGDPGLPVMPFLEASKAMARGIGYGGEGDVLTAAFFAR